MGSATDAGQEKSKANIFCLERICPICETSTPAPYGAISAQAGCCTKKCSEKWDALPFDEKQKLLDAARGHGKPQLVAQAA